MDVPSSTVTLRRILDKYIASRPGLKQRSAEQLRIAARSMEDHLGRPASLSDLTAETIARWMRVYGMAHAPATVNSKRRAILTLWRSALKSDLIARGPADVPTVREPRRVPQAWTVEEIGRLVAAARGWPGFVGSIPARCFWPSLYLAVYDTGARIGSMLSARTCDLSLVTCSLVLQPENDKNAVGTLHWLHRDTIDAITEHFDPARDYLWPWPYHRRTFWVMSARIIRAAGLSMDPRGRGQFHRIRRTTASYAAANGGIDLAQSALGHSSAATTLRHYIDPRIARRQSAVDVLPRPGD